MQNVSNLKLGKLPPKLDSRTLRLSKYIGSLPVPPDSCDQTGGVTQFGMMINGPNSYGNNIPLDGLGDCTCAAVGHGDQISTLNTPEGEKTPPDQMILNLYENCCGYVPGDPSTDNGGIVINVLNYVKKHGLGHKEVTHHQKYRLRGYADTDPGNSTHVKQAIQTFGMVDIGLQLPISAQSQTVWDVASGPNARPGTWGGHSVVVVAYTPETLTCVTWGALQEMTWAFWNKYVDESHALFYQSWLKKFGDQSPDMLEVLEQDLVDVTN
jgi:hypothetical protein